MHKPLSFIDGTLSSAENVGKKLDERETSDKTDDQKTTSTAKDTPSPKKKKHLPRRYSLNGIHYVDNNISSCDSWVKAVTIRQNIGEIADNCFSQASGLTSVEFLGSVERVGEQAFAGCTSLKTVCFHRQVGSIEREAFKSCTNLQIVDFLKGLKRIGDFAFKECVMLSEICIPDDCDYVGRGCFQECLGLHSVQLPIHLSVIPTGLFAACAALDTIRWPETRESQGRILPQIEDHAFLSTLCDLFWETFMPTENSILKRTTVVANQWDPNNILAMIGNDSEDASNFLPQLLTNNLLNSIWEKTGPQEEYYEFLMTVFMTASTIASFLSHIAHFQHDFDDRADMIAVLVGVRNLLSYFSDKTREFPELAHAYAISTALFMIGTTGEFKHVHDNTVARFAMTYFQIDNQLDSEEMNDATGGSFGDHSNLQEPFKDINFSPEDVGKIEDRFCHPQMIKLYEQLQFGPNIPFRYDPMAYYVLFPRNKSNVDYYLFIHALERMMRYKFNYTLIYDHDDLSGEDPEVWYGFWGQKIQKEYSKQLFLTVFSASKIKEKHKDSIQDFQKSFREPLKDIFEHFSEYDYITVLSDIEVEEISSYFEEHNIMEMNILYTLSLYKSSDE